MGEALELEGGGGLGLGFGFGLDLFGAFFVGVGAAAEADELGVVAEVNLIGRQDFAAEIAVGDGGGEDSSQLSRSSSVNSLRQRSLSWVTGEVGWLSLRSGVAGGTMLVAGCWDAGSDKRFMGSVGMRNEPNN